VAACAASSKVALRSDIKPPRVERLKGWKVISVLGWIRNIQGNTEIGMVRSYTRND
jgi:hypothetical protein